MVDLFLRVAFYIVIGIALAGACAWYLQSVYHEVTGRGEVVIAPFEVVGAANNKDRGLALAHMLHARLHEIERDMRVAQQELMGAHATKVPAKLATMQNLEPAPVETGMPVSRMPMPQLLTQAVELRAGLLEPADINISVGGVQVGGVVAWMQRLMSNPRTLVFTLYERKDGAQLSGSLNALDMRDEGVRIDITLDQGQDSVRMDKVVERAAYEIVRRRLARDSSNRVEVLSGAEFQQLIEVLRDTAALNRRVVLGRGALPEFQELLGKVSKLADEVPEWYQLNYLTASIAESAKDMETAVTYYGRAHAAVAKDTKQTALGESLKVKLAQLKETIIAAAPGAENVVTSGQTDASPRKKIESYVQAATTYLNGLLGHDLPTPKVKINAGRGPEAWMSYWDGQQVVVPRATADLPDIVYREASWPHILRIAGSSALDGNDGSTEAILYSYADVFPMLVQLHALKQNEKTSRWELGPGWVEMFSGTDLAKAKTRTPYLSFASLGTPTQATAMGATNQVSHMRDFDTRSEHGQRKYINSGILNKAFYEAARKLGTAKATEIWVTALKQLKTVRKPDFARFAGMLIEATPASDRAQLREALLVVGLDPQPMQDKSR